MWQKNLNSFGKIFYLSPMKRVSLRHHLTTLRQLTRWGMLSVPVAFLTGTLVAGFLWILDWLTSFRMNHPWLLMALPMAGILIYFLYKWSGKKVDAGNNLIIEEIHQPGAGVPVRMAPLVLITTWITHLFGGSAGREGTAVQMGGSMAAWVARLLRLSEEDTRVLLMCGVAAGFGAVFGTPVAGAIFALEVLASGLIRHQYLLPCLIAAILADITCTAYGIHHTKYSIASLASKTELFQGLHLEPKLLVLCLVAGLSFGLAALLFAEMTHQIKGWGKKWIPFPWMTPALGGLIILLLSLFIGDDYLGLGVHGSGPNSVTISSCFTNGGAHPFSWFWKILFTAITLGSGFKGGEVTPLFFIGAALGNTLGMLSGAPIDLMAGLGFIGVFAGATNTPIACTLMGVELFGSDYLLYYLVVCAVSYYFSGKGIYSSQRSLTDNNFIHK